jgi:hypothetical protein
VSALINYGPGNPPVGAVDPADTYRCIVCNDMMWDEVVDAHELDLQICADADCMQTRIRTLKLYEKAGKRLAELVKEGQYSVYPIELHAELLAVALAVEHYGV